MSLRVTYCCFCISLRTGLLIWGYFAMIATYLSALSSLYEMQDTFYAPGPLESNEIFYSFLGLLALLTNFIFHFILVAGLHKKSCCMLEVYKGYLMISMMFEGIAAALYIPLSMRRLYYRLDDVQDSETAFIVWIVLCSAVVLIVVDLLWKYYILVCVGSLNAALYGDKNDYLSEQDVGPDVIILDNTKKRRKDDKIMPVGDSDDTHDNTGTGSNQDNIQLVENPNVIVHDNTNKRRKDDDILPVGASEVTVHDNTGTGSNEDNIQPIENPNVIIHDNTNKTIKDDYNQQIGNSDIIVIDNMRTGSKEDNIQPIENQYNNQDNSEIVIVSQLIAKVSPETCRK